MKLLASAVLLGFTFCASAAPVCWTVSDLAGEGSYSANHYRIEPDGFTGKTFRLVFNGDQSTVTNWDVMCKAMPGNTIMCGKSSWPSNTVSVELWTVDEAAGIARMVRTHNGYGTADVSSVFVGKAVPCS